MNRKETEHIIHNFFIRLKKHNRAIKRNRTAESIKTFRIEVKKLRAFLRLISLEAKDPDELKLPSELKKMHQRGGVLRDQQLQQQRLRDAIREKNLPHLAKTLLHPQIKETKKTKEKLLSLDEFVRSEKKIRKHLPEKYDTRTIMRFFREKEDVILEIIRKGTYKDKELHDIRKKIKDILYILKLYSEDLRRPLGFRFWTSKELKQVKALEELLGKHNDAHNAMTFLGTKEVNKHEGDEKKLLLAVRREVLSDKRKLRLQILEEVKKLNLSKPRL
jgi:hypothetical protein